MNMTIKSAAVPALLLSTALAAAVAQSASEDGAWRVDETGFSAWITADAGPGLRARLTVRCQYGSPYAAVSVEPGSMDDHDPYFLDGDVVVEIYANRAFTNSIHLGGMGGAEAPVTPESLAALRGAEFIRVTGGRRPMTFSGQRSAVAIDHVLSACSGQYDPMVNAITPM
jgi:hypothetical protein